MFSLFFRDWSISNHATSEQISSEKRHFWKYTKEEWMQLSCQYYCMEIIEHKVWNTFQFPWALLLKEVRIFDWPFKHTECRVCWNKNTYIYSHILILWTKCVSFFRRVFIFTRRTIHWVWWHHFSSYTETAVWLENGASQFDMRWVLNQLMSLKLKFSWGRGAYYYILY